MQLIIDLDLQEVIQDFGLRQAALGEQCKSQDTPRLDIYFAQSASNVDLGTSPGLRFGVFTTGNPNSLCTQPSFTRNLDTNNNVRYSGYPNFDTAAMAAVLGSSTQVSVIGEVRYQVSDGTIARTMDIPVTVIRSLLAETILDTTQAAFTVPAVASNVTIQISNTGWLHAGLNLTIGNGAGAYQVVSITDSTHFVAENQGGSSNAAPSTVIPSGTTLGIAPAPVLPTYPDPSTIELTVHKGVANGYASLDASTLIPAAQIPVDTQTITVSAGKIASSAILASVAANFTTPAANATVSVTLSSTSNLKANQYVRIPIGGYYVVTTITDSTHAVLTNNGDPFNASSGVTITTGQVLLPAQAAAGGGGSAGQNAFTTTTANFTVPASGAGVSVTMGSTAWLGLSGYVVFISGAGYYAVGSITDSTHALLTNLGYAATNAASGTVINSGAQVSPGGLQGPATIATGANAYDTTQASFTMPAAAASVNVTINNTGWLGIGQEVYIAGAGYFSIASIVSATIFSATNSNYPGAAAPGSTIASNAKVSPAGLIGPQGAGGSGVNAFSALSANFTQPAINATVTVTVGTTAWMATGQIVYVVGGGYYSVFSIADLTHANLANLGYSGNAASGATVSSGAAVNPAGLIGASGATSYTQTSATFTMPAALQSVTVSALNTAALQQNQNIYIGGAGYFSVSSVLSGTQIIAINLGSPGNVSSGTSIPSGAGITPAGATGPAINTSGGFSTAADAIAPAGAGEISNIASQTGGVLSLKKFKSGAAGSVALTDQGGSTGDILIDVPVDGTTISVVSGKLTAAGGGGGAFDPRNGVYFYDDFVSAGSLDTTVWNQASNGGGGATAGTSGYGYDSTRKTHGLIELATGTGTSGTFAKCGGGLVNGYITTNTQGEGIVLGAGTFDIAARVAIEESSLPVTGVGYTIRLGFVIQNATISGNFPGGDQSNNSCVIMEYSPDQNSGNFRVGYCYNTNAGNTYANCTGTPVANTYGWWELKITSAGVATAYFNGTSLGSITISGSLLGILLCPYIIFWRNNAAATNYHVAVDTFFYTCPYTR